MKLFFQFLCAVMLYSCTFALYFLFRPLNAVESDDLFESVHIEWHPATRAERFPSVEERVRLYMSAWYLPACPDTSLIRYENVENIDGSRSVHVSTKHGEHVEICGVIEPDTEILLERDVVRDCARSVARYNLDRLMRKSLNTEERVHLRRNMRGFCRDVLDLMDLTENYTMDLPLVAMLGDESSHHDVPSFSKWRWAASKEYKKRMTETPSQCWEDSPEEQREPIKPGLPLPPILWKLGSTRHWDPLDIARITDTEWDQKRPMAVWRGAFTGKGPDRTLSEDEVCFAFPRCKFVYEHANSKLIDAGFDNLKRRIGDHYKGVRMKKHTMTTNQMQGYKVIISLEGNDVASGLKWNLLSRSVVLMPAPTKTSWAMEELLEPWVHYIPMEPDGSNALEMVQWVLDHDRDARRIAERATLFMYDLLYHPDAEQDDLAVKEEIVRRYSDHWRLALNR